MKHILRLSVFFVLLSLQVQAASISEASQLAKQLGSAQELPRNVQLRFQVMASQMKQFEQKNAPENLLKFFSDTRNLFWSRPVSSSVEQSMRAFEQQMVELSQQKGRPLDLPPVGYAPIAQAAPSTPATQPSRNLVGERRSLDTLSALVLRTEEICTDTLVSRSSPELLALRDSLTVLRQDMADGSVAAASVRNALSARARFLVSEAAVGIGDQLMIPLNNLAEGLKANFPPERLRQSGSNALGF